MIGRELNKVAAVGSLEVSDNAPSNCRGNLTRTALKPTCSTGYTSPRAVKLRRITLPWRIWLPITMAGFRPIATLPFESTLCTATLALKSFLSWDH